MTSDAECVRRARSGHPEAFAELVDRHAGAVHAFVARRAGRQSADDLLGEVWARAFGALGSYDTSYASALPWLYGIARNVLKAYWRHQHVQLEMALDPAHDPWPAADERLDARDRLAALVEAVRALPPDEREVLLLVAWEQLSPAEAALTLGIPQGTARSRLHRARAACRARLSLPALDEEQM